MVFCRGLQYDAGTLAPGVQTLHPGGAGPVGYLLGGTRPTGCFLFGF